MSHLPASLNPVLGHVGAIAAALREKWLLELFRDFPRLHKWPTGRCPLPRGLGQGGSPGLAEPAPWLPFRDAEPRLGLWEPPKDRVGSGAQSSSKMEEEKQQFLKKSKETWTTAPASSSGEKPQLSCAGR